MVSLFAVGEGWHNFHHAYPYDYAANEYGFLQLNLTTGFIDLARWLGLAHHCRRAKLPELAGDKPAELPAYSLEDVAACANQAACILVVRPHHLVPEVTPPPSTCILRLYSLRVYADQVGHWAAPPNAKSLSGVAARRWTVWCST